MSRKKAAPGQPSESEKIFRSYRLDARTVAMMDVLSDKYGIDKTACIQAGIALLFKALDKPSRKTAQTLISEAGNNSAAGP